MKQFIINIVKGILIGIANIIPGLSGATLALILGVYEKIINILAKFDGNLLSLIKRREWKNIKKYISLEFLLGIGVGIIIGFIVVAKLLNILFTNFETYTWSYFFGIMIASVFYITKYTDKWEAKESLFFMFGTILSLGILFVEPSIENHNLFFVFICGVIGVIGMLIPGLSGSYLLILLGNYKLIFDETINHITNPSLIHEENYLFYITIFLVFLIGQLVGILIFSRLIKWMINNYKNITFATLAGCVFGSVIYIWPWQNNIDNTQLIHKLSYPTFEYNTDIYAILIITIGISTIIMIEKLAKRYKNV